jgi:hypothetical protein
MRLETAEHACAQQKANGKQRSKWQTAQQAAPTLNFVRYPRGP